MDLLLGTREEGGLCGLVARLLASSRKGPLPHIYHRVMFPPAFLGFPSSEYCSICTKPEALFNNGVGKTESRMQAGSSRACCRSRVAMGGTCC